MHLKQQIKENEELRKFHVLRLIRAIKQLLNEPFTQEKHKMHQIFDYSEESM